MRTKFILIAILGAAALPGCVVEAHRHPGHARVATAVDVELTYIYFPSHRAYYCESTDEWWIIEGGGWTRRRTRPVNVFITHETPWVAVNIRGPRPEVRFEEHHRSYPQHWRPAKHSGPPPGRGWDKPGGGDRRGDDDRRGRGGKRGDAGRPDDDDRRRAAAKPAADDRKSAEKRFLAVSSGFPQTW